MSFATLLEGSCPKCHSLVFRVEHFETPDGWKEETVCLMCKQKALN